MKYFLILFLTSLPAYGFQSEYHCNKQFCDSVGGVRERRFDYEKGHIFVDCATTWKVYEGGLDKRSSYDRIHQAGFASEVSGKKPVIVIYDTDGKEGRYEYQIKRMAGYYDIEYISWTCK